MEYAVDPAEFEFWWNEMLYIFSLTLTMLVLYSLYMASFIFSIYTLTHRNPAGRRFLLFTASAMFLLGAVYAILCVVAAGVIIRINKALIQGSANLLHLQRLFGGLELSRGILVTANNFITDLVLVRPFPCRSPN
ncbi:hypothetical protein B0H17DRAFT_1215312 [Mycena rosella]|uniref:Uncharacterized protein n=1 Tax=Mycena rosella TaxID=1033263 RepID=A0AAD7CHP7_MYCRO|nr:hypothetical protein B0H17DRAFT_1215312 [Mycena rosella]